MRVFFVFSFFFHLDFVLSDIADPQWLRVLLPTRAQLRATCDRQASRSSAAPGVPTPTPDTSTVDSDVPLSQATTPLCFVSRWCAASMRVNSTGSTCVGGAVAMRGRRCGRQWWGGVRCLHGWRRGRSDVWKATVSVRAQVAGVFNLSVALLLYCNTEYSRSLTRNVVPTTHQTTLMTVNVIRFMHSQTIVAHRAARTAQHTPHTAHHKPRCCVPGSSRRGACPSTSSAFAVSAAVRRMPGSGTTTARGPDHRNACPSPASPRLRRWSSRSCSLAGREYLLGRARTRRRGSGTRGQGPWC